MKKDSLLPYMLVAFFILLGGLFVVVWLLGIHDGKQLAKGQLPSPIPFKEPVRPIHQEEPRIIGDPNGVHLIYKSDLHWILDFGPFDIRRGHYLTTDFLKLEVGIWQLGFHTIGGRKPIEDCSISWGWMGHMTGISLSLHYTGYWHLIFWEIRLHEERQYHIPIWKDL